MRDLGFRRVSATSSRKSGKSAGPPSQSLTCENVTFCIFMRGDVAAGADGDIFSP